MSEAANSHGARRTDGSPPLDPLPPLDLRASNSDDSPTIISKSPVRLGSSDDAIANSVRGRKLAHFELIAPIGVGGMAAVLKARDLQLDRTVALKILPPDMANDAENIRRFHQEARAAAKLDHENIARVYYCGEDQNLHFIAFEFVQGDNLRTILERRTRIPVRESLHYLIQIASGLTHAAGRGVVHRDIKPSNIIVSQNGRAKLVDMGLARSLTPHKDDGLTQSGVTLGTFDYISPEQALEPREADVRSDIYSLGCTFYHLLTGQPPVPEGTAAKKLHHHQHVPPVDPRELNPDIPDEIAVILSKMMAKNAADRYARPEQLVQHLLRAAQRLEGYSSSVANAVSAEGMVMVDAPMPLPATTTRPLLLGAVALAAVVTLVLLLSQAPSPQRHAFPNPRPLSNNETKDKGPISQGNVGDPVGPVKTGSNQGSGGTTPTPAPATFTYSSTQTHRELREFLRKLPPGSEAEILLASDLILPGEGATASEEPGLVFKGRKITIRAQNQQVRPTIWFSYDGLSRQGATVWAALLLEADEVTLQGLRLVVDARESQLRMNGVLVRGGRRHLIEDCQFIQTAPGYREDQRLSSLVFDATTRSDSRPSAQVRDCAFVGAEESEGKPGDVLLLRRIGRGGQDGLTRIGPVQVQLSHCAFGPHLACLRLEGVADGTEQACTLEHCSALLSDGSTVFQLARDASAQVRVKTSLFGRGGRKPPPAVEMTNGRGTVLIRQFGDDSTGLTYQGDDNRYYNFDGFWLTTGAAEPLDWEDFQTRLVGMGREDRSQLLELSPWQEEEPLPLLGTLRLARAFQVQDRVRELRVTNNERQLIGVERCAGVSYVSSLPALERKPATARKEKVVDPRLIEAGNGQYPTLRQALDDAQNGDVILIKATGEVPIKPVRIERGGLEVTIKPAPGYRPVLTADTQERDATIFHIQEGKLTLSQLAFKLQPTGNADAGATQAVVSLLGEGSCRFSECVITLAEPRGAAMTVAILADPGAVMMKKPPASINGPRLNFENCLIRGKGDLVWCRASRAFRLEMQHSLIALSGSLVHIDSMREDAVPADGRSAVVVELKNVTTCLNEHLVNLRGARDLKSFAPVQCKASNCLFTALAGKTLVHLDGMEATEEKLKEKLTWDGSSNAYGNFMEMLDQQPRGTEMRPPSYGEDSWKRFSGETDARFARIKFAVAPEVGTLARVKPDQFKTTDVSEIGATLDLIPAPPPEERAATDKR